MADAKKAEFRGEFNRKELKEHRDLKEGGRFRGSSSLMLVITVPFGAADEEISADSRLPLGRLRD